MDLLRTIYLNSLLSESFIDFSHRQPICLTIFDHSIHSPDAAAAAAKQQGHVPISKLREEAGVYCPRAVAQSMSPTNGRLIILVVTRQSGRLRVSLLVDYGRCWHY